MDNDEGAQKDPEISLDQETLKKVLGVLVSLEQPLVSDMNIVLKETNQAADAKFEGATLEDLAEVSFWLRSAVRTLVILIDSIAEYMDAILVMTPEKSQIISTRQRKRLSGRLGVTERVSLAFRLFPKLFAAEPAIDTGGEDWRGLVAVAKARHRIVHPVNLEDTLPLAVFPSLRPTFLWYSEVFWETLARCARQTGESVPPSPVVRQKGEQFRSKDLAEDLLGSDAYKQIQGVREASLMLNRQLVKTYGADLTHSLNFFKPHKSELSSLESQFAGRNLVRTLFSSLEGLSNCGVIFVEAADRRSAHSGQSGTFRLPS